VDGVDDLPDVCLLERLDALVQREDLVSTIEVIPIPLTLLAAWNGWPSTLSGAGLRWMPNPSKNMTAT
jgi:hypothetical protein